MSSILVTTRRNERVYTQRSIPYTGFMHRFDTLVSKKIEIVPKLALKFYKTN